ncbi:hypothetical protein [Spirosoma luteum]|uniref:hypothetical protein n=1 Tax=Spirosoma luteum TaxID=431553 RepID=UPI0003669984|nr:hypothetical protein [Spirosoma luteum]
MKTTSLKTSLLVVLTGLTAGSALAQEWSFGPKAYLGLSKQATVGNQVQIGDASLYGVNYGDAIGNSVGAFARFDRPRWYAQAEGMYGAYSLTNASVSNASGGSAIYPGIRRSDARLIAGFKPLPWLRLNAGLTTAFNQPKPNSYASLIRTFEGYTPPTPSEKQRVDSQLEQYRISEAVYNSYKKTNLEGQLGIGADIGGLTLDLTYARSLTPAVDGITVQNQTYAFKQNYGYWALGVGYKLFPLKRHLLAPRKNKAYARIKQDIPFYRNEFYIGAGLLAEDIGSQAVYENRYTRYLTRRLGIMGSLTYSHNFLNSNDDYRAGFTNQFALLTGVRFLPLYSRRHTIGITTGPMLTYTDELQGTFGRQTINGQLINSLTLTQRSAVKELQTGWHSSIDYNFALTDRLIVGPWLRLSGQSFIIPDYANAGIQVGYRF